VEERFLSVTVVALCEAVLFAIVPKDGSGGNDP
jgi:hypothetical protein